MNTGTREWSSHSVNIQVGCEHNCRYCYAREMAVRYGRCTLSGWATPRLNYAAIEAGRSKLNGRVMFPTTHDITAFNVDAAVAVLLKLARAGNEILIVSKPRPEIVRQITKALDPFKSLITFRFTIGSCDPQKIAYWEPGAPPVRERLESLSYAYNTGWETGVSAEPLLSPDPTNVSLLIESVRPFCTDAIWIGELNQIWKRVIVTTDRDEKEVDLIKAGQGDQNIKRLYNIYKSDPLIKWKESIKRVVGLHIPQRPGHDS